jgi:hypothetical protein
MKIKKNDIVEIIGNIPFNLKFKPRPILGKVVDINGFYIYVNPKYQRFIIESLPNELKKIE